MEVTNHGRTSTSTSTPSTPSTHLNSPIPITRSDPNSPYPTTFVTADSSSFKQVVQLLTGSDPNPNHNNKQPPQPQDPPSRSFIIPPIKPSSAKKQQQQLYERRNSLKNNLLMINTLPRYQNASFSPRKAAPSESVLSPSVLDFPALTLSPVTPLSAAGDEFDKSSHSSAEEERSIAEKGFYLHPSPRDGCAGEPQLLPLFPVTSPRVNDGSGY